MSPTVHDVARATGVSPATVSRSFTRPELISEATRQRVVEAAERLGYRPNRHARALVTGRTGTLALLVPDIANPFFLPLVRGAERAAQAGDCALLLVDTEESPADEERLARHVRQRVDGLVLVSPRMPRQAVTDLAAEGPVVLVNREVPRVPTVLVDACDGMRQVVGHLADLGHRRVAYLAGPSTSWSDAARRRGLDQGAARTGVETRVVGPFPPNYAAGAHAADAALATGATALVAFNDLMAIGALKRLQARGLDVPGDVSVVGSDDTFVAELPTPALTTVAAPVEEAGRTAVRMLPVSDPSPASGPAHPGGTSRRVLLPTQLHVRGSTGPARARPHR